ncbi:MAG: DUF3341 domain-containing protein [Gemmataceae bacterium]
MERPNIYGMVAEFGEPHQLIAAARAAREAGYVRMDAYTPFPIEELAEALGVHSARLPFLVLAGGLFGCFGGFFMQYYASVLGYPLNVGGRPLNSWPAFIPVTFELTILGAALAAVLGMLALNGLPQPYHPLFHIQRFALATNDRFFLCIEARDARFDLEGTRRFFQEQQAREVWEVPR